ncbi:MAG: 50S ribosomal protein L25 [Candidatus Kerfeldbacteria bacterium]|nr:50S ribosomal protein L25 [Candidatus Kerfeldbacteria bacterium]
MTTLNISKRTAIGKSVKTLRHQDQIPGVIYGHGVATTPVTVQRQAFDKAYREVGASTLIDLALDDTKPIKALIQDVQWHPLRGTAEHIDFHQVRMDEKLTVDIPFKYTGESRAVKELGGTLVKNIDHLKVECLPQDLVHEIGVSISGLVEFDQSIMLRDLKLPPGLKVLSPQQDDEVLVTVMPPRSEAELAALKTEVKEDVTQVAKVEEKKPEEETEITAAAAEAAAKKEKAAPPKG